MPSASALLGTTPRPCLRSLFALGKALTLAWMTASAPSPASAEPPYAPASWLARWTLKTADTTLTLGVRSDQQLYVSRLASPAGWNWLIRQNETTISRSPKNGLIIQF